MDILYMIWPEPNLAAIAHLFDTSGPEARLKTVLELGRREMAHLFDAAAHAAPTVLDDFVPPDCPPTAEIVHYGKNSLPLVSRFEKRFRRVSPGSDLAAGTPGQEVWGYNRHEFSALTGPAYFVAHPDDRSRGIVFDDAGARVPPPDGRTWPHVRPDQTVVSRLVYAGVRDVMRRISRHVTLGRIARNGATLDAWFFLVRDDVPRIVAPSRS